MNIELVEAALESAGRRLVVLDEGEVDDDLVRDMTEVLTSSVLASTAAVQLGTGPKRPCARRRRCRRQ